MLRHRRPTSFAEPNGAGAIFRKKATSVSILRRIVGFILLACKALSQNFDTSANGALVVHSASARPSATTSA